MSFTDASGSHKKWIVRFVAVCAVGLVGFLVKAEHSRLNSELNAVKSDSVNAKVTLGRLEEKIDAVKHQLDRIEKKGVQYGQSQGSASQDLGKR